MQHPPTPSDDKSLPRLTNPKNSKPVQTPPMPQPPICNQGVTGSSPVAGTNEISMLVTRLKLLTWEGTLRGLIALDELAILSVVSSRVIR